MRTMQVMLNIPMDEYQALTKIADARQTNVHSLVERLVSVGLHRGPGRPRTSPQQIAAIRELEKLNYSRKEIGTRLGISYTTAGRYMIGANK